jgi:outer membrane protein OmpA-like peptidoglycan-associated protein
VKRTIAHRGYLAAGAVAIIATTVGCSALLGAPSDASPAGPPVTLTQRVTPSMLVVVAAPGRTGQWIEQVVTATARPREDLTVIEAEGRGRVVVASQSPAPATVVVPGKPVPPAKGASSYQEARYEKALARWRDELAAGRREASSRTKADARYWARTLRLRPRGAGQSSSPAVAGLDEECRLAASAVSGLIDQAGGRFGTRRVVLLDVRSLAGMPQRGELDGDDVIVLTSGWSGTEVGAAQEDILAAGAARAAVLGPEVTLAQIDQLVTEGLSQHVVTEALSGRALFADNSSVLLSSAARILVPLVGLLRRPGASGVINGYASTPGSAKHNKWLSERRATAVAKFLERRGVPQSSLQVFGHGASNLVAPGASGNNRRVVVVIEEPAA